MIELGKKYHMLTVIKDLGMVRCDNRNRHFYLCQCECKQEISIRSDQVGKVKSCGCIRKLTSPKNVIQNHTHKQSGSRLYSIWQGMKDRCHNPNNRRYERYGGRGIGVCEEWEKDFVIFHKWSVGNGYKEGLTIDRINNDGNYEPLNCRWVDGRMQSRNRSTNITIDNKCLTEIAENVDVSAQTMISRYNRGDRNEILTRPTGEPTGKKKGENNNNAKISNVQAYEIKQLIKQGVPNIVIADKFNVSKYLISDIKRGKTWKHI